MKAFNWHGKRDVRVDNVRDPTIQHPTDAIARITSTGICGSDPTSTRCSALSSMRATAALAAPGVIPSPSAADIAYGVLFTALAVLVGLAVLVPRRLPDPLSAVTADARQAARRLHALHSGHPGDYITWLTLGVAVFTGVFAVTLR